MPTSSPSPRCPDCGTRLADEPWAEGQCLACLLELAVASAAGHAVGDPGEESALVEPVAGLVPGRILGGRYRIRALLGCGGMGEVWLAFDLKLRVDIALKALHHGLLRDKRALETLRREVRVARQVVSPNICRIYHLDELEGRELVSMEYVDGTTLGEVLRERSPLDLAEARDIAAQFLAGLEAIHEAGLVHRDVKPENLMLTRAGRVVVMDFGIAKGLQEGRSGTVSGTPAYMAPEQARGEALDARIDVFAAGVVLAEMVAPEGVCTAEARKRVWERLRSEPPWLADTPWASVLARAVAADREQRYATAAGLSRALEEVTLRAARDAEIVPYPGLASFTEEDAEYFFGRELEVEEMGKKLRQLYLLALIGPSGAGKSSFLRAGLLPALPEGWRAIVAQPGNRPFAALARALAPELAGDAEAVRGLADFDQPQVAVSLVARWRQRQANVLVVVDQFEELFTLSPAEVRAPFAELLRQLAFEADVHVLLTLRDDFLFQCAHYESLAPVFDEVTPLKPLSGGALRRALVQPALKCGYRFEDESLVDEMVAEVEGERGALPLAAFAAARLWEHRDRERGLVTREAYEYIGGVAGALAQHAEATLERIGQDREPLVRELFRNLVTAQVTRAALERDKLLSVFDEGEREAADEVLHALIDARLLTSYELPAGEEDGEPRQRIEIIHESLLTAWPRLVRWQTQDQDTLLLRDQLRQAAQLWQERDRPEDLLWTGSSYKEFELWRERYGGGLSETEEEFAGAMIGRAERHRRHRQLAVATAFATLLAIVAVVSWFWRRAEAETLRAEASRLISLGRLELERDPTAALAYARKSLEVADTPDARRFVLEVLWRGPVARILSADAAYLAFSPDGRWLASWGSVRGETALYSSDGRRRRVLDRSPETTFHHPANWLAFSGASDLLLRSTAFPTPTGRMVGRIDRWLIPEGRPLPAITTGGGVWPQPPIDPGLVTTEPLREDPPSYRMSLRRSPPFPYELPPPQDLGVWEPGKRLLFARLDPSGAWRPAARGRQLLLQPLDPAATGERTVGEHTGEVGALWFSPSGDRLASWSPPEGPREGEVRVWSTNDLEAPLVAVLRDAPWPGPFDARSSHLSSLQDKAARVWDIEVPLDGRPLVLTRQDREGAWSFFDSRGNWLATTHDTEVAFWPMDRHLARVLRPEGAFEFITSLVFSPDSGWLLSTFWGNQNPHLWPLRAGIGGHRDLLPQPSGLHGLASAFHPDGQRLLVAGGRTDERRIDPVALVPLSGGQSQILDDSPPPGWTMAAAFDREGRRAATAVALPDVIKIWDLQSGSTRVLDLREDCEDPDSEVPEAHQCWASNLRFAPDGRLLSDGGGGVRRWDLASGRAEWLERRPGGKARGVEIDADGRWLLTVSGTGGGMMTWRVFEESEVVLIDLLTGRRRVLEGLGRIPSFAAIDPAGEAFAVGDRSGAIHVGRLAGGEPHLLLGHREPVDEVRISPDGRWIASMSAREIRVWPMPDLSRPPLHTLPLDELLAKLRDLTNLEAVRDPDSPTGWKLEVGPFPGWEEVPAW